MPEWCDKCQKWMDGGPESCRCWDNLRLTTDIQTALKPEPVVCPHCHKPIGES